MAGASLIFNVLDWYEGDEFEDDSRYGKKAGKKYTIRMFGRTEDDKSVAVKVENFTPFFFVEVPESWTSKVADKFVATVVSMCEDQDGGKKTYNGRVFDKDETYHTKHLVAHDIVERHKFHGFTAGKKFKFVRFVFDNMIAMKRVARVFNNYIDFNHEGDDIGCAKYQIYESNIDPYLRFIHIRDLESCGWVKIYSKDCQDNGENTTTDINIKCDWKNVHKEDKIGIAPFKIASFDIECTSGDGSFPLAQRASDKIIQIGTVFTRYGNNEPYKKTIITLGTCEEIEGVEVIACKTEREVLMEWQRLVVREDPDILTGYNIFYFDEKYMYDRSLLKGIECGEDFSKLSRMCDWSCEWKESKLSSSALGDNILRFYKTPGRIQIDLMKVVQRDHKLSSYKLDSVAEHFIKEPIKSIKYEDEMYIIESKNTHTVKVGNYIRIEENDEYMETKLQITKIEGENIYAKPDQELEFDMTGKLYWGLVKDDIHPNDIFRLQRGGANDRKVVAQYCIQDCALVSKLIAKLDVVVNNMSMANVCYVPISYIFMRGQGIKSLSLVSKECRRKNYVIPVIKKVDNSDSEGQVEDVGYEGATVFEPHIGFHKVPISVLDFNSLYPSSEIAYNMSHETIVFDSQYDNLSDYTYKEIEFTNMDAEKTKTKCRFAKHKNGEFGIIPSILDKLIKGRKDTKKQMEAESDPFKKTILDGKQLALKVTANSLYGQLGAATSPICMKELAASTTAVGRLMLESARDFVEGPFVSILESVYEKKDIDMLLDKELEDRKNTKFIDMIVKTVDEIYDKHYVKPVVIYGDSVSSYTPTILKVNGNLVIEEIEKIGNLYGNGGWKPCDNDPEKEYCEIHDVEVWTDNGWTQLQRVIRHKLHQNKKMIRVNTHIGVVDVTDDHSLLRTDKTEVSSKDLKVGDQLLHNEFPSMKYTVNSISLNDAESMGYGATIVPNDILNACDGVRRSFWYGFYDADYVASEIQFNVKNQLASQTFAVLCASLGFNVSIDSRGHDDYRLMISKQNKYPNTIKKMHEIEYEGYVYDLTTENHHFAAGVGKMIVHNTDSIFIKMNITNKETEEVRCDRQSLEWSIKLAQMASKLLKIRLPPPENMEYEKTFWPFAIMAKKKYVGNKYEDNPHKFKQASMGIVLKRRDNANIVKKIIGGIIDIMMNQMDSDKTIKFAKRFVKDMLKGKYPIKEFVTTKTLKGNYKVKDEGTVNVTDALKDANEIEGMCTPDMSENEKRKLREYHAKEAVKLAKVSMAHVKLAKRIAERDPGNKPQINERIPFVTIEKFAPRGVKLLQGDMIEHPEYIKEKNLQIDYLFYLTNQIVNPAVQILDLIIENSKEKVFMKTINKHKEKRKERQTAELSRLQEEETKKTNNEMVEKYMWMKMDSDEDETTTWMPFDGDIQKMIDDVKASPSKPKSKSTKSKKKLSC